LINSVNYGQISEFRNISKSALSKLMANWSYLNDDPKKGAKSPFFVFINAVDT